MKLINEFKEFSVRGNMVDIAVGVVIGAAFNKMVDVLVKDIFLPPLSLLTGGINLEHAQFVLRESSNGGQAIAIGYGRLLGTMIDFFIVAIAVFLIVKIMNTLRQRAQDANDLDVPTPKDIELLTEVKELIKAQNEMMLKSKGQAG